MSDWTPEREARLRQRLGPMWSDIRQAIKRGKLEHYRWKQPSIPGKWNAALVHTATRYEVATLWYCLPSKGTMQIDYMETREQCRRAGAMTKLVWRTIHKHPVITRVIASAGNRRSTPWLERHGFKRHPECGWLLEL